MFSLKKALFAVGTMSLAGVLFAADAPKDENAAARFQRMAEQLPKEGSEVVVDSDDTELVNGEDGRVLRLKPAQRKSRISSDNVEMSVREGEIRLDAQGTPSTFDVKDVDAVFETVVPEEARRSKKDENVDWLEEWKRTYMPGCAVEEAAPALIHDVAKARTTFAKGNFADHMVEFGPYGFDEAVWHSGGEGGTMKTTTVQVPVVKEDGTPVYGKDGKPLVEDVSSFECKLDHAWISTCDCSTPHYSVSTTTLEHHSDRTFTAWNAVFRLGDIPVFYLPWMWGTTDGTSSWILKPSYSGSRGYALRVGRIMKFDDKEKGRKLSTQTYVDAMSKRGFGLGNETTFSQGNHTLETLAYGIHDWKAPDTEDGYNRRFKQTEDRYRLKAYYMYGIDDITSIRGQIDYMSDIDMMENWFKREYRSVQQTKSYLSFNRDTDLYSVSMLVRPRINEFYTVVEKLPEVRLDIHRQNLADSWIQYQGSNTAGYYSMKWRNFKRHRWDLLGTDYIDGYHNDPKNYSSVRLDSLHFIYLPMHLDSILEFIPRAGFRVTYYSKSSKQKITREDLSNMMYVDNPDHPYATQGVKSYDTDGGAVTRYAWEFGGEMRSRMYSDWTELSNHWLALDGMRHVVTPYVNYTFAPDPSHNADHLYFFDEVDRLERQHFVRFGLDQQFQTRRFEKSETFVRWQSYFDYHLERYGEENRCPRSLGTQLDLIPRSWLNLWGAISEDVMTGNIQHTETGVRFGEEDKLNVSLRYLFRSQQLTKYAYSMGSSLTDLSHDSSFYDQYLDCSNMIEYDTRIPINPQMAFRFNGMYDYRRHSLFRHFYYVERELHCWRVLFGFGRDDQDTVIAIMFQLSAYPGVKVNLNL